MPPRSLQINVHVLPPPHARRQQKLAHQLRSLRAGARPHKVAACVSKANAAHEVPEPRGFVVSAPDNTRITSLAAVVAVTRLAIAATVAAAAAATTATWQPGKPVTAHKTAAS